MRADEIPEGAHVVLNRGGDAADYPLVFEWLPGHPLEGEDPAGNWSDGEACRVCGKDTRWGNHLICMPEPDDDEDDGTLGPCGCVDYHYSDCSRGNGSARWASYDDREAQAAYDDYWGL